MTGVEVLATKEVAIAFTFNWLIFWIAVAVIILAGLTYSIFNVLSGECDWQAIPAMVMICALCGLIIGTIIGGITQNPTEYETQYKVTISDEVSMNDFLDRYEILSQEGKIYTVRERND